MESMCKVMLTQHDSECLLQLMFQSDMGSIPHQIFQFQMYQFQFSFLQILFLPNTTSSTTFCNE